MASLAGDDRSDTEPRSLRAGNLREVPPELLATPAVWRAVIAQALDDLTALARLGEAKPSNGGGSLVVRRQRAAAAEAWLLGGGEDFVLVCDLAGLEPGAVRARARRVLAAPPKESCLGWARRAGPTPQRAKAAQQVGAGGSLGHA